MICPIQPATFVVSCFKQTSRRLLELSKILFLSPNELTVARRILHQLGSIQSVSALPEDPTFNQINNKYDNPSYKRICAEFREEPTADFSYTHDQNHGLG